MNEREQFNEALGRLARSFSRAGERIADEARLVAELSRLRLRLGDRQYDYRRTMEEIGTLYFRTRGQAPEEDYREAVARAQELLREMGAIQEAIREVLARREGYAATIVPTVEPVISANFRDDIRPAASPSKTRICPHCGAEVGVNLSYCIYCKGALPPEEDHEYTGI